MENDMKLRGLRVLTGIGALLLTIGAQVQAEGSIHKAAGEKVTLAPSPYGGSVSEINWKVDGNKLVDMEMSRPAPHFYRLQDRATMERNGSLTITDLNTGDSALYKAEVVVNNVIHDTYIRLTVHVPPTKPTITNRTIDGTTIEVTCGSVSPNVKYEWRNDTKILSNQQSYNASRSTEDVALTCVVYNEASGTNSTIIIPCRHDPGLSGGQVFVIVLGVLILLFVLLLLLIIILLKCFADHPWAVQVRKRFPHLARCISKKTNVEQNGNGTGGTDEPLIDNPGEIGADVSLKLFPSGEVRSMELRTDVMSVSAMLGPPGTIERLGLAVGSVEDPKDYTATVVLANGETCVSSIKEPAAVAPITCDGGTVKLDVPNAGGVKTIDLKAGDETLYRLTVDGLQLQINNITLEPESVTITRLKPKDGGAYRVDLHSIDERSACNAFNLEVVQTLNKPQAKKRVTLMVKRKLTFDPLGNGLPDGEPIGSVTFHPIDITNVASIAWKKDNKPAGTNGHRIQVGRRGDLVINDVTSADAGSYTVQSEGQTLEQEFILRL